MERLNKYLAHAGVGSRRHCDEMIAHGRVAIDGQVVRELGLRIDPEHQKVFVDGQPLHTEKLVYWLLNKPRGYLCTNDDPGGRPLAIELLPHVPQRVYTVGRLDEDSEGLLLMTNDGDLAFQLMHPRFGVYKTYLVQVAGRPTASDLQQLLDGVWLSDGYVKARKVRRVKTQGESTWLQIVLSEGKNREVRRMLARLGHKVMRLKRIAIGPIKLDRLPTGKSRKLKADELTQLREFAQRVRSRRGKTPEVEQPRAEVPPRSHPEPDPRRGRPMVDRKARGNRNPRQNDRSRRGGRSMTRTPRS
jgi:23S rRNA pseudouridine2605 synthase